MAKVVMGFSGLSVPDQVERGRDIKSKITGNANFTTPNPTMVVFGLAIDALETAYNESRNRDRVKIATMKLRRIEFLALVVTLAGYVQETSEGDGEKILSTGFFVKRGRTPKSDTAGTVYDLRLEDGSVTGKVKASWAAADDAVIYIIRSSPTADFATSELKGFTTKTHKELSGFMEGSTVWVQVTPIGRENAGTQSDPVSIIVR
jgi:hypothetical protein